MDIIPFKFFCLKFFFRDLLTCCARHILATQDAFKNQKPLLQELIEERGHKVIFYPKFHCELNYIEMYLGLLNDMLDNIVITHGKVFKRMSPMLLILYHWNKIRKYVVRASRFMDCYRKGLTVLQAEYIVKKKYKSHRRIPDNVIDEIDELN